MAKKNADKSYGWYKAQDFGDYIERVVGEMNIKLVSIVVINICMSGEYGQELEKKKFEDKDETDYSVCSLVVPTLEEAILTSVLKKNFK